MKITICVASKSNDRLDGFLKYLSLCHLKGAKLLILGTGEELYINSLAEHIQIVNPIVTQIENEPMWYARVMKEKLNLLKNSGDHDIVFLTDDDYMFNPWAISVAKKIFMENEEVDYLSLLSGPGLIPTEDEIINLSGFNFMKVHSCMGGSVIARWNTFLIDMESFFAKNDIDNQWDQLFWQFLDIQNGTNKHVYTILDISLMQHCNLISHFVHQKENVRVHMRGVDFEPLGNPYLIYEVSEINVATE